MKVEVLSFVISYHKLDKMAAAMISTELRSTGPKRDRRPGPDRPTDRDQDHGPDNSPRSTHLAIRSTSNHIRTHRQTS